MICNPSHPRYWMVKLQPSDGFFVKIPHISWSVCSTELIQWSVLSSNIHNCCSCDLVRWVFQPQKGVQKNFTLIKVYLLFPSLLKVKWLTSWLWRTIELAKLWLQGNWLRSSQELLHWIRLRTFYENDVLSNVCNCWNKEALGGVFPSLTKFGLELYSQ